VKLIFSIASVFLAIVIGGCTYNEALTEKDLINYVRNDNNGLIKTAEAEGFKLTMIWKPNDLIASQQVIKETKREFDSLRNYFSKYLYFNLEMTKEGKDLETYFASDPASFADKISFLSASLSQHIQLITPKDTLPAVECLYSRSYGMGSSNCLLVFNKPKEREFEIQISGYPIGFGKQFFSFSLIDIENAPRLKTNYP
jgi:hypothetical protein